MFPVEVILVEDDALSHTMEAMRTWLDHRHFEPAAFRYSFGAAAIVCRVEFTIEAQASAFAQAFGGKVVA